MRNNPELNRKLVSLLFIIGGIAGVTIVLWTEVSILTQHFSAKRGVAALMGGFAFVFGLCTWTGVELWREKPAAFRLAQILLIAQIPNISFPGLPTSFIPA